MARDTRFAFQMFESDLRNETSPSRPLINGDFETAPAEGFKDGVLDKGPISIPGWNTNGNVELVKSGEKQGSMLLIVPQGSHAVRLGNDAEISQDIKVEKGSTYSLTFSAARTCAQLESLNVSVPPASQTIDLQTLYSVEGWNSYASAFQSESEDAHVVFKNTGMEDDPTCGPIIDNIAIKKLFIPAKEEDENDFLIVLCCISSSNAENAVVNRGFEEGPWMFQNATLGVLLPTNIDEETSSLPGWTVDSNRAVRYVDSYHYTVPEGKRAVELLSGKEGIISQMVETTPEKQYQLTFSLGQAHDKCQQPLAVMAFAGDQSQNIHLSLTGNTTFQSANLTFKAKAERSRIAFYSVYYNTRTDDHSSLCGPVVDDVKVWLASSSTKVWGGLGPGLLVQMLLYILDTSGHFSVCRSMKEISCANPPWTDDAFCTTVDEKR
ncbi:hypothetical protein ACLOJK_008482 [Asimina triloba]